MPTQSFNFLQLKRLIVRLWRLPKINLIFRVPMGRNESSCLFTPAKGTNLSFSFSYAYVLILVNIP